MFEFAAISHIENFAHPRKHNLYSLQYKPNVLLGKEQRTRNKNNNSSKNGGGIYYAPGMGPDIRDSVFIIFLNFISIN